MKQEEGTKDKKGVPNPLTTEQIERLKPLLKSRIPGEDGVGCFLCKWIYEDLEKNASLTDYPKGGQFPAPGKYQHLKLEGMLS